MVSLEMPAMKPPAGQVSNLDNPSNMNTIFIATMTVELVLTTLFVFMRMYTKIFLVRALGFEDYTVIGAWVMQIVFSIVSVITMRHHAGAHMWDVREQDFFELLYWANVYSIVYIVTILLIKVSIILQYLRIFVPNRKDNKILFIAIHTTAWTMVIFYILIIIFQIALCDPRKKISDPMISAGHCFNENAIYKALCLFNVVSDFALLILPLVPIWRLQLPLKKRILLIVVFAAGFLACVTSVFRAYYTFVTLHSGDFTYAVMIVGLWTWAEATIGIFLACLPILPRFFQHFVPKVFGVLPYRSKLAQPSIFNDSGDAYSRPEYHLDHVWQGKGGAVTTWTDSYNRPALREATYFSPIKPGVASVSETREKSDVNIPRVAIKGVKTRRADFECEG